MSMELMLSLLFEFLQHSILQMWFLNISGLKITYCGNHERGSQTSLTFMNTLTLQKQKLHFLLFTERCVR